MAQRPPTQESIYLETFQALQRDGHAHDPAWVQLLRNEAISRFNDLGFPITRRGNEEWKYTNVGPLARVPFRPAAAEVKLQKADLRRLNLGESAKHQLVFVDGSYVEELSSVEELPAGVRVANLTEAMVTSPALLQEHLAHHASGETNAFVALNTAFVHHGAFVHIPDGVRVEEPVLLLFLSTAKDEDTVSHPRVLIITGGESEATLLESYISLADARHLVNAVAEVVVGQSSTLRYYTMQRQSEQAFHITNTQAVLGRDASFSSVNIDLGGGLVRHNLNVLMGAEGASCSLNGLYMTTRSQHVDNQVIIDHAKGHTTARELYKGILDGKSRTVFHGSIIVREGARKVDADQSDKNLLLSDQAEADTKPAFWIYCDDVKCTHGASCGQIDEEALFYMRSRGIGDREARSLLVRGFVSEIVDSIEYEPYRSHVDGLVQSTLREWLGGDEAT